MKYLKQMQDAYPGVLNWHEGHTTKSSPLRFTLLISRKSDNSYG